jgi:hypothetical protein
MKKISILTLVLVTLFGFFSCQKDEDRAVLDISKVTAPVIDNSLDGISFEINNGNLDSALVITWKAANYGINVAATYTVQMGVQGENFANPSTLGTATDKTTLVVDFSSLNNSLLLLESNPENPVPLDVEFRVISVVSNSVDTVYSNAVKMTIKPVYIVISYPQLYVPGAYQGWKPDEADSIGSINSDGKYEGYIYMPDATEFKFTSARDWQHINYGNSGTPGLLDTDGGAPNLSVPEGGFYKFNVNTNDLTWTYLNTTWALIGDATPGGWDEDTPMTYNEDTQLWTVTLDLNAGDIKFRANGSWDLNYGSDDQNGLLKEGAGNIHVDEAGNYTVILDLSHTVYKYSVEKN